MDILKPVPPQANKRAITIKLDAGLVARIESIKSEAQACGLAFSVTEICAAALAEAIPVAQEELLRRSAVLLSSPVPSESGSEA